MSVNDRSLWPQTRQQLDHGSLRHYSGFRAAAGKRGRRADVNMPVPGHSRPVTGEKPLPGRKVRAGTNGRLRPAMAFGPYEQESPPTFLPRDFCGNAEG